MHFSRPIPGPITGSLPSKTFTSEEIRADHKFQLQEQLDAYVAEMRELIDAECEPGGCPEGLSQHLEEFHQDVRELIETGDLFRCDECRKLLPRAALSNYTPWTCFNCSPSDAPLWTEEDSDLVKNVAEPILAKAIADEEARRGK